MISLSQGHLYNDDDYHLSETQYNNEPIENCMEFFYQLKHMKLLHVILLMTLLIIQLTMRMWLKMWSKMTLLKLHWDIERQVSINDMEVLG